MSEKMRRLIIIAVSVAVGLAIGFGGSAAVYHVARADSAAFSEQKQNRTADAFSVPIGIDATQISFRNVAQKLLPSIVTVSVSETQGGNIPRVDQSPWFDFFFGRPNEDDEDDGNSPEFRSRGFGSGVIVERTNKTYYILTNAHVIGSADEIIIIFLDSSEEKAELVGIDQRKDLALLSFQSNMDIPVAELGDSDQVQVGDWVLAIGSPFNFQSTVTAGIVSALGRRGGPQGNINDFIQTDAAINQGNSGGALVNTAGKVIGINTWITSRTGTNIGLGFAIPINNVKKPIADFIVKGRVEYGWLGVSIRTPTDQESEALSLPEARGAFVINVFQNSPADKAGILPGDVIFEIDGDALNNSDELLLAVGDYPVNETAMMKMYRQGSLRTLRVRISARESERAISDQNDKLWPGIRVAALSEEVRERLELADSMRGVVVEEVEQRTPSATAGLRAGDVIVKINEMQTNSVLAFYAALNEKSKGNINFEFVRQKQTLSIGIVR